MSVATDFDMTFPEDEMAGASTCLTKPRTCSDCSAPISVKSTGRCRSCAMVALNNSEKVRHLASKRMSDRNRTFRRRPYETPPEWCPFTYHDLYRKLVREQFTDTERKRIIFDDITVQARRSGAIR